MLLERPDRLIDQRDAVREEECALDPVAAHQEIAERDDCARLPCTSGHDEKHLSLVIALEGLADPANGPRLIEPLDDPLIDRRGRERFPRRAALHQELELVFLV